MASSLAQRAESLAADKDLPAALSYYGDYLKLRPDDVAARMRQAELYDEAAGNSQRTVELYQGALSAQGIAPEQELRARRRLTELLLQGDTLIAAETEVEKLEALEQKALAQKPEEWRWPGLKAMILARFRVEDRPRRVKAKEKDPAQPVTAKEPDKDSIKLVTAKEVDEAFAAVLDPASGRPQYYRDPMVYLARYAYRCQQHLAGGSEDVAAAVKLAPTNPTVLCTAAAAAEAEGIAAEAAGDRPKAMAAVTKACDFCERAIAVAPANPANLPRVLAILLEARRLRARRRRLAAGFEGGQGRFGSDRPELGPLPSSHRPGPPARRGTVMKDIDASLANRCQDPLVAERASSTSRPLGSSASKRQYDEAVHLLTDLAGRNDALPPGRL